MRVEKKTNWEGKGAAELNEQGFAFAHQIFRPEVNKISLDLQKKHHLPNHM